MTLPAHAPAIETAAFRILWIHCRMLHPLNGGDRIRSYGILKELKRRHSITYLCVTPSADEDSRRRASAYCDELLLIPRKIPGNRWISYLSSLWRLLTTRYPEAASRYRSCRSGERRAG